MNKLIIALLLSIAALLSFGAVAVPTAHAQGYDDDGYRYRHRRYDDDRYDGGYERHRRCRPLIRSTGVGYLLGAFSRNSAIKAWKREAEAVYGQDFKWSMARDKSIECGPYLAVIRCTAAARPCS